MTRDNSIVVEQLVREFKKGPRAVDGIDLHVAPGEIYGFLGPNGAGKSTTVLMLTTLLPPTAGSARVGGYDVRTEGPKVRSVIGAALQEAALDPLLTGRDHLKLQTMLQAIPKADRKPRQNELLDRVGLTDAADRKVGGYSGGMKRRLDLALALVHRPSILFLDEPTTGLDPQSRTALWEEVARLAREDNVTVFLTTQYLEEADVLADRVGIIDNGKIVAEGTPTALKEEIGRPSIHVIPCRRRATGRGSRSCSTRFGEPLGQRARSRRPAPRGDRSRRRDPGDGHGRRRRRRRRAARTHARRRLPGQDRAHTRGRRDRGGRGALAMSASADAGRRPRTALDHAHRAAAGERDSAARLSGRAPARELGRAEGVDPAAGVPDRLVPRLRARRPVHPGRPVLDDERGHRPRARHPDGVLLAPLADAGSRLRPAGRADHRHRRARRRSRRCSTSPSACCSACASPPVLPASRCCSSTRRSSPSASARSARSSPFAPAPASRSRDSFPCSSSSSSSPR